MTWLVLILGIAYVLFLGVFASNVLLLHRQRNARIKGGSSPSLSVLIPARNEADNLSALLPVLLSQDYDDFDVVVYDDQSTDGTADVLRANANPRLRVLPGADPPGDWIGKVHALYQASRGARGDVLLFLDADVRLADAGALRRLVASFESLAPDSALSGFTRLEGGARLLTSLVPFAILTQLPWALVRRIPQASLAALNGQCWMIRNADYQRLEPHLEVRREILEDVMIGRYLKRSGVFPVLVDVQDEVSVHMYGGFGEGWRGFRKNVYLLMGGEPSLFVATFLLFAVTFVLGPALSPPLLAALFALKACSDRYSRFPWWVTLFTPLVFGLAVLLQIDSAFHHFTGRVAWKGRRIRP